jgi:hypothetical protein
LYLPQKKAAAEFPTKLFRKARELVCATASCNVVVASVNIFWGYSLKFGPEK